MSSPPPSPQARRPRRLWRKQQSIFYALHPDRLPAESIRLAYTFGLGGISVLATLAAVVTGVLLTFYYTPTVEDAYASVTLLEDVVVYGSLVRALHYWSAQLLVVAVTLHMARILFTGAFGRPRRLNWLIGLALLVLTLLWSFSGYALRWDESTLYALLVGTNLLKEIPAWGDALYALLVGDAQLGTAALVRFYSWHVIGLTLLVFGGIVYHLFRLRRDGGISRPPLQTGARRAFVSKDLLFVREITVGLLVLAGLILLSWLVPAPLSGPAQFDSAPDRTQAPWFFLWVQALLRWLPAAWAGVFIPLLTLLALVLLPWLNGKPRAGVWFDRRQRPATLTVIVLAAAIVLLSLIEVWS